MIKCSHIIPYISKIKTKNGKELSVGDISKVAGLLGSEYHIELMNDTTHLFTFAYNSDGTLVARTREYLGEHINEWDIVDTGEWKRFTEFRELGTVSPGTQFLLQSGQVITVDRIERPVWAGHVLIVPTDPHWAIMAYRDNGTSAQTANHNIRGYKV